MTSRFVLGVIRWSPSETNRRESAGVGTGGRGPGRGTWSQPVWSRSLVRDARCGERAVTSAPCCQQLPSATGPSAPTWLGALCCWHWLVLRASQVQSLTLDTLEWGCISYLLLHKCSDLKPYIYVLTHPVGQGPGRLSWSPLCSQAGCIFTSRLEGKASLPAPAGPGQNSFSWARGSECASVWVAVDCRPPSIPGAWPWLPLLWPSP